ncbi:MAG: hypothetical protein ACFCGT_15775 [Sandaracinaceae bacterium]
MVRWHSLALPAALALAAGCFGSHGRGRPREGGDGGPAPDGGMAADQGMRCPQPEPIYEALACPARVPFGQPVLVELRHEASRCCSDDAPMLTVESDAFEHRVRAVWPERCDCPSPCSPRVDVVALPELDPGVHEVLAGAVGCQVEVLSPDMCFAAPTTATRHTRAVVEGEAAVVTLRSTERVGCACSPRMLGSGSADEPLELARCGCCLRCACLDTGYEATLVLTDLAPGARAVFHEGAPLPLDVAPASACFGMGVEVQGVTAEDPPPLVRVGPAASWVRATGTALTCCPDEPVPVRLAARDGSPFAHAFVAELCDLCPADCSRPVAVPFTAEAPLFDLPEGTHEVIVDEVSTTFEVALFE